MPEKTWDKSALEQVKAGEDISTEPVKSIMDTGFTFHSERLLLETESQETLDAFKAAYYRLEHYVLGDYRN